MRLGFEEAQVSVSEHNRLRGLLPDRVELVAVQGLVERLRAVKEPEEIARIREAAKLADAALEELIAEGLIGRTEREVALALAVKMYQHGASRPSFEAIVAAGPHGALPHASPREVEIGRGQLVVIDWGAELDGYCSDCTRTLAAGEPGAQEREIYGLVLEAQLAGLHAVRAGAGGRDVDSAARELIVAAGQGEHFATDSRRRASDPRAAPRLSQRSEAVLEAGATSSRSSRASTCRDGFGVRIEDLVVVTEDGPEIMSSLSKELTSTD